MPVATEQKSVTKTALIAFVRENSTLNIAQSKTLADQLLADYSVTAKPPVDLDSIAVEIGQLWQYIGTPLIVRITDVEMGPRYVPNNPINVWGPANISWQNTADPASTGITQIESWRQCMRPAGSVTQVPHDPEDPTERNDH
jgi:hypothetical protein